MGGLFPERFTWFLPIGDLYGYRFTSDYDVYAFIQREIGQYMFLKNYFVFYDLEEPLIFFLARILASFFKSMHAKVSLAFISIRAFPMYCV